MNRNKRLRNARKKRVAAARYLDLLAAKKITLREVLEHPPKSMGPVRLWTVLNRAPKLGEAGAKRCLQRAEVWPETRMDALTPEEAQRVLNSLPPRAR